ncbi:hypothetical protein JCM15415_02820 [Methanobacterium movens]
MVKFNLMGAIALIIGIILLISPALGLVAIGIVSGFILTGLGVWMAINAFKDRKFNQSTALVWGIFAIISLAIGLSMIFQIFSIEYLAGSYLFVTGILLLIAGILILSASQDSKYKKYSGLISVILGILYLLVASLALNPLFLGAIIGLAFIIFGLIALRVGRK